MVQNIVHKNLNKLKNWRCKNSLVLIIQRIKTNTSQIKKITLMNKTQPGKIKFITYIFKQLNKKEKSLEKKPDKI